jgi:hypothetical protein
MTNQERVPLSTLPHEIQALTGDKPPPYRKGYNAAVDGRIPAERGENGRWTVARTDLPLIAATLCPAASA